MRELVVGLCFLFSLINFCRGHSYSRDDLPTPQMITESGFPAESHEVYTEDGFILTLHRIPGNKTHGFDKSLLPVFFQHGLFDSSASWVMKGPNDALAFSLASKGYDVWFGNVRGNTYSARHKSLVPHQDEFWDWSWHEIGLYDIPASVDYILNTTNHRKLTYIGHSMGTTVFFVMCSMRPEYNQKVDQMFALAPVGFISHTKSPIRVLTQHSGEFKFLADRLGSGAFLPRTNELTQLLKDSCLTSRFPEKICENYLFLFCGYDPDQFDSDMMPLIVGHNPAGASTKTVVHYAQEVESSKFCQYDYGEEENLKKYNSSTPPKYDLSKITAPISLYYSDNDLLAQPADVRRLKSRLYMAERANLYRVNYKQFNHLDFLWARDVKVLLNDLIENLITSKYDISGTVFSFV